MNKKTSGFFLPGDTAPVKFKPAEPLPQSDKKPPTKPKPAPKPKDGKAIKSKK